jgi:hypothetical protein
VIETTHAYAELGGLLKERFGILLTSDQCKSLVEEARGMTIRWQAYGGHSGQPDRTPTVPHLGPMDDRTRADDPPGFLQMALDQIGVSTIDELFRK